MNYFSNILTPLGSVQAYEVLEEGLVHNMLARVGGLGPPATQYIFFMHPNKMIRS